MTVILERIKDKVWTDEEFMALADDGNRYEIVDGELINLGNSGMEHGNIGIFLGGLIEIFVRQHNLGVTCDSSTAFKMKRDNKRSPDISFVSKERLIGIKRLPKGFFDGAPDLVVEIISPGNTFDEIHNKIEEYFESGTRLLWVIHPDERYVQAVLARILEMDASRRVAEIKAALSRAEDGTENADQAKLLADLLSLEGYRRDMRNFAVGDVF